MSNKFSVIMSIYKSDVPEYVRIALDSILNQTYGNFEIIILDSIDWCLPLNGDTLPYIGLFSPLNLRLFFLLDSADIFLPLRASLIFFFTSSDQC